MTVSVSRGSGPLPVLFFTSCETMTTRRRMVAHCGVLLLLLVAGARAVAPPGMVKIDRGDYVLGGDEKSGSYDRKNVRLKSFFIDEAVVTNQDWRAFVKDTKYKSESERFGWSFVLAKLLPKEVVESSQHVKEAEHWVASEGAYWRQPLGKGSNLNGKWEYPVVHVSYNDALEYCKWKKKRLPTEEEWEVAAGAPTVQENADAGNDASQFLYPWGNENSPSGDGSVWKVNIWQGKFPNENSVDDGFLGLAPAKAFGGHVGRRGDEAKLYNMVGNVWEWTQSPWAPAIPATARRDVGGQEGHEKKYVLKGGSFVDSLDGTFNHRASIYTRMGNTPDSGGINTGFRCAKGKGGGGKAWREEKVKKKVDQDKLQAVLAEEGIEGLQKYLKSSGIGGSVLTPDMLKDLRNGQNAPNPLDTQDSVGEL